MKKSYSLSKPRTSQRLANKKAPKDKPTAESVVGDSLGLPQPLNDLVGPASGYTKTTTNIFSKFYLFIITYLNKL